MKARSSYVTTLLYAQLVLCGCASNPGGEAMRFEAVVFDGISEGFATAAYIDSIDINEENGTVTYSRQTTTTLVECGDSNWYCLSDGQIEFAVPIPLDESRRAWSYRGINYSVISSESSISGHVYIVATSEAVVFPKVYIFSKSDGLRGIVMVLHASQGAYVPAAYLRID